ncbi:DNA topoisomerase IB [Sphingomonas xanthus]|uniref:DNA topoisomerase n=1 Tax=Sphingomonas xanthus TaxID=2594473 RepID=A0A516IUN6_9SPHN|nr:DNA topoisomerase IB [Sphingomonas xanthus]
MLRHSSDSEPGYSRKRKGRYWQYYDEKGNRVTSREEIDRLNSIALPPAYTDAWFCKDANGHIQATGKDARGRKQYRYHPDYRSQRDAHKYDNCREFGEALPKLRKRIEKDLRRRKLVRETVLAAVVRLLDKEFVRIGNEQYARRNQSFGLTTLRNRHLKKVGNKVKMRFKGKHGIVHEVAVTDASLKRVVRQCEDLPGQHLFQYLNGDGEPKPVTSTDVNDYIREATGSEFTAKHFRTWGASVIFFEQLLEKSESKRLSLKTVLEPVAEALGNTPTMSRKSYVHPCLIEAVQERPEDPLKGMKRPRARTRLTSAETGFLKYLKRKPRRRRIWRRKAAG